MLYESFAHCGIVVDVCELDELDEEEVDDHAPGTRFMYAELTEAGSHYSTDLDWSGPVPIQTEDEYEAFTRELRAVAVNIDRHSVPLGRRLENRLATRGITKHRLTPRIFRRREAMAVMASGSK